MRKEMVDISNNNNGIAKNKFRLILPPPSPINYKIFLKASGT
jgi:hypothetical protein